MANSRITKAFAEELGQSLGGCAAELTLGIYYREAAKYAKAGLNFIPFFGLNKKRRFQILWSCCLEALAFWVAKDRIPELWENEKLSGKVLFQMQTYDNSVLNEAFVPYFSDEEMRHFSRVRKDFIRLSDKRDLSKDDLARHFLDILHEQNPSIVTDKVIEKTTHQIGLAMNVFEKMITISLDKFNADPAETEEEKPAE